MVLCRQQWARRHEPAAARIADLLLSSRPAHGRHRGHRDRRQHRPAPGERQRRLYGITDPLFEDSTWTDASGYYTFGPLLVADYEVRAAAFGYYNGNVHVSVTEARPWSQDFALKASIPELSPVPVGLELQVDRVQTVDLTLLNNGSGDLQFHVSELPADTVYPVPPPPKTPTGIDPQLVAELGESADGTAEFVIYMAEQADLSAAFQIQDRSARGHYVYNTLRATAERTQAGLRAELARLGCCVRSAHHRQRPGGQGQPGAGGERRRPARGGLHRGQPRRPGPQAGARCSPA